MANVGGTDMKKLDFLICGAQKAGTSALTSYMRDNPEVYISREKELHLFDNEKYEPVWWTGLKAGYALRRAGRRQKCGDATPITMYWRDGARKAWMHNRGLKLIVLLRNPIERAYSHWSMETGRGNENKDFLWSIKNEEFRSRDALPYQHRIYSYIDRGFYCSQLRELYRYFGRSGVLVILSEELREDPEWCLHRVWGHIEVGCDVKVTPRVVHEGNYREEIGEEAASYLKDIYRNEIQELSRMTGRDLSGWLLR